MKSAARPAGQCQRSRSSTRLWHERELQLLEVCHPLGVLQMQCAFTTPRVRGRLSTGWSTRGSTDRREIGDRSYMREREGWWWCYHTPTPRAYTASRRTTPDAPLALKGTGAAIGQLQLRALQYECVCSRGQANVDGLETNRGLSTNTFTCPLVSLAKHL